MPRIGDKIPPALAPLARWRLETTGQAFKGTGNSVIVDAFAMESPSWDFSWADVDLLVQVHDALNRSGTPPRRSSKVAPLDSNALLWDLTERISSLLPPRERPPSTEPNFGIAQAFAEYPVDADGLPRSDGRRQVSAASVRGYLLGGILGDLRDGAIGHATQLTLFTLEGLLRAITRARNKGICHPPSVVFNAYRRWRRTRTQPLSPGSLPELDGWLVREPVLHGSSRAGSTTWTVISSEEAGSLSDPRNASFGSDALVRVAPVGFFNEDAFELGSEIAALTHGHPEAYSAAGAFAEIISHVVRGRTLEFGVRRAVMRLDRERTPELAVKLCDAYLWGLQLPDPKDVSHRFPTPQRAADALCLAVLSATAATEGQELLGRPRLEAESSDSYASANRTVRQLRGQLLGCLMGASLPSSAVASALTPVVSRLASDVETEFRDDSDWWRAYPGW